MAIDFPNSPTNGDLYSAGGKNWQYNGTAWVLLSVVSLITDGSISTTQVANSAITTAKIADGAVTLAKVGAGVGGGLDTDAEGAIAVMDIGA